MSSRKTKRSGERRAEIAQGALTVLAERGSRGLTHRAVDATLSLPNGSTSYYFNSRAELIRAAADSLAELDKADLERFEAESGTFDVEALFRLWMSDNRRNRLLARLELFLEAARDPEFREHLAQHRAFFIDYVSRQMVHQGASDPNKSARAAIASFEGALLRDVVFGPFEDMDPSE